jgi:hypothetical protein
MIEKGEESLHLFPFPVTGEDWLGKRYLHKGLAGRQQNYG